MLQARVALKLVSAGEVIDNLILVGSPIGDKSDLMKQVKDNRNIEDAIRYDIEGDPLSNPKDIWHFLMV